MIFARINAGVLRRKTQDGEDIVGNGKGVGTSVGYGRYLSLICWFANLLKCI